MNYSIRTATENDAESIIDLLNPIIAAGTYTVMEGPISLDDQLDYMRNFPARGVFNVAAGDDSGKILGIQSIEPISAGTNVFRHVAEISTFVSLGCHGKGIGRALSRATFQAARTQGFSKILATIRGDNPGAISFYRGLGFEIIGTARKHAYIGGKYIDEIFTEIFIG